MYAILLFLSIWPFSSNGPGHSHTRAWHASHLRHIQQQRAHQLSKHHGKAHPSLINR